MDLLKKFNYRIHYHRGKGNVVADALSWKGRGVLTHLMVSEWDLCGIIQRMEIRGQHRDKYVASLRTQSTLI